MGIPSEHFRGHTILCCEVHQNVWHSGEERGHVKWVPQWSALLVLPQSCGEPPWAIRLPHNHSLVCWVLPGKCAATVMLNSVVIERSVQP